MFENEKEISKDIRDIKVGEVYEVMVGKPALVYEDAILKDAVDAMTENLASRKVYVVDREGVLKGVITTETMLRQVGYKLGVREAGVISWIKYVSGVLRDNVTEYMEKNPVTVTDNHKVLDALRKMVEYHLNDLPVVDEEGKIVGELLSLELMIQAKKAFKD